MKDHNIGKFCSVAKKDTIVTPKDIPGYIAPEGQLLKTDGQIFNFKYTPILYHINYDLDGGISFTNYKTFYTIESEDYIPETPFKDGYIFLGWSPEKISKGSIGDITMTAKWIQDPILETGEKLNRIFSELAHGENNIVAIKYTRTWPTSIYVNISITENPILAYFDNGVIYIYSEYDIFCNQDMRNAFANFTLLRDISVLEEFICPDEMDINGLFKNCSLLSDVTPVSRWNNFCTFSDYTDAFSGTYALSSGRVPAWYNKSIKIKFVSTSGKVLKEVQEDHILNEEMYPKSFNGYNAITEFLEVTNNIDDYIFEYKPIAYKIYYELNGGKIHNEKTEYTIEDETYYPPKPEKIGYNFSFWSPRYISHGEYGSAFFIANYKTKGE